MDDLAALLKSRQIPAINFLIERGALPLVFTVHFAGGAGVLAPTMPAEAIGVETTINEAAREHLEGCATGLMADD